MSSYRVNLGPRAEAELKRIVEALRLKSKEEAIQKALSLLNFVSKEIEDGSNLVMENKDKKIRTEVEL